MSFTLAAIGSWLGANSGALIGAGAAAAGARASRKGSERTAQMGEDAAQTNREWQEYMSNTAHRREVADLRAAGLNPILSASKGGQGASTPSGAVAQVPDFSHAGEAGYSAMEKSASAGLSLAQRTVQEAQKDLVNQQVATASAQAADYSASAALKLAQIPGIDAEIALKLVQAQLAGAQIPVQEASAKEIFERTKTYQSQINEAASRTAKNFQDILESKERIPTYGSSVRLNDAHAANLVADLGRVLETNKISALERQKLELALHSLKTSSEIDKSLIGESLAIVKRITGSITGFGR